jgi:hypothetical protein
VRSHCVAVCIDTEERRFDAGGATVVTASSGSPGSGSEGASSTPQG